MIKKKVDNFIPRDATNIIKGVALILMFVHHFFTFPKWHVAGASYPLMDQIAPSFNEPLKICVAIFAFLTGYFYFHSKSKTYKYSIKKSSDVYLSYVIYYLILSIPVFLLCASQFTSNQFVLGFLTLNSSVMTFGWYVAFYILAMLILPLYAKLSKKSAVFTFLISLILPNILTVVTWHVLSGKYQILNDINNCLSWFPCVAGGYLIARYNLFAEFSKVFKTKNKLIRTLIALIAMILAAAIRLITRHYDFASAALFIWAIVEIYNCIDRKKLLIPISIIGKYSLQMWFLHSIFFNICRSYTQPFLFFASDPVIVTLWGLLICLVAAIILDFPIKMLTKAKNKVFRLE